MQPEDHIDPGMLARALTSGNDIATCAMLFGCSPQTVRRVIAHERKNNPAYGVAPIGGDMPALIKLPPPPTRDQLLRAKWAAIYLGLHSPDGKERLQAAAIANQADLSELVDDSIDTTATGERHLALVDQIQEVLQRVRGTPEK